MRSLLTVIVGSTVLAAAVPSAVAGGVDLLPDPDPWRPTEAPAFPSPSGRSQAQPWERYQTAFALNLGMGSAVGGLGLTCSFLASSLLSRATVQFTSDGRQVGTTEGVQVSAVGEVLAFLGPCRISRQALTMLLKPGVPEKM
jgi:hypothetical protein